MIRMNWELYVLYQALNSIFLNNSLQTKMVKFILLNIIYPGNTLTVFSAWYIHLQKEVWFSNTAPYSLTNYGWLQSRYSSSQVVTEPFKTFKKLKGKDGILENHDRQKYHNESVFDGKPFLKAYHSPHNDVVNLLNVQRLQQLQENRQCLYLIFMSIIFLEHQNITLQDHLSGESLFDEGSQEVNKGKFREFMRYRVALGYKELSKHSHSSSCTTYTSKTTHNELINFYVEEICKSIV